TRSISVRSWSVGWPAHPGAATRSSARTTADTRPLRPGVAIDVLLDLAEDVLGQQLLEVDRRFDLSDPPAGRDELLRSARTDTQVLFPDQPHRHVDPRSLLHQAPSARSGSPRMNCRTTGFGDAWMTAGGPTSAIRPSCSMATVSAISKISGISWLTMTAVKRSFRWSSRI